MTWHSALQKLGFRQKAYQQAFGIEGSPANLALLDLAEFCAVWRDNPPNEDLREMAGRRQAFMRIFTHLRLNQTEMEIVYRQSLVRAAENINRMQGEAA